LYRIVAQIFVRRQLCYLAQMPADHPFGPPEADRILNFGLCDLPFDLAQGGELVEPFDI